MNSLTWNQIDFSQGFHINEDIKISNEADSLIEKAQVVISTLLLIIAGAMIVGTAGIYLYSIYKSDQQIKAAIQMAKDENRQIDLTVSNGYQFTLNLNHGSNISMAGGNANATRIVIYPRNYYSEQIVLPNGNTIFPS